MTRQLTSGGYDDKNCLVCSFVVGLNTAVIVDSEDEITNLNTFGL